MKTENAHIHLDIVGGIAGDMFISAMLALLSSFIGLLLSYHYSVPSGPAIILVMGGFYAVSITLGPRGLIPGRALEIPTT